MRHFFFISSIQTYLTLCQKKIRDNWELVFHIAAQEFWSTLVHFRKLTPCLMPCQKNLKSVLILVFN